MWSYKLQIMNDNLIIKQEIQNNIKRYEKFICNDRRKSTYYNNCIT